MYGERALLVQRLEVIDRLTGNVHHTSLDLFAHRHCYRAAGNTHFHSAAQTGCQVHCNATYHILAYMLLNLNNELTAVITGYLQSVMD